MTRKATAKVLSKSAGTLGGKALAKTVTSPMFLVADVGELGVRVLAKDEPKIAEAVGTTVGLGGYAAVGGAIGGPIGAGVGAGVYVG